MYENGILKNQFKRAKNERDNLSENSSGHPPSEVNGMSSLVKDVEEAVTVKLRRSVLGRPCHIIPNFFPFILFSKN